MASERYEPYDFANRRHIGPSPEEMVEMLRVVGANDLDALIEETVPKGIRQATPLEFGHPLSERGALDKLRETADKNRVLTSLIGQGYHGTIMPPAIQRNILENPAWYTAYTPYQPEISQGRLEALLNFQTLVSDLTGARCRQRFAARRGDRSGGGHGDGASRDQVEGGRILRRRASATRRRSPCCKTRAEPMGWKLIVGDPFNDLEPDAVFGAIFQYPGVLRRLS